MDTEVYFLQGSEKYEEGCFTESFDAFLKGAENGDLSCMTRLASMYSSGEGVEANLDKAIEWESRAANAGDLSAIFNLGISYRMKGDIESSKAWLEKALSLGDGSAGLELAKFYIQSGSIDQTARKYLIKALEVGNLCQADEEEINELLAK